MYAEIQTKSYTILQINWRQWPVIYKSQFVLLLHLSVTTYNLKLMKGYLHSSNGTLHTAISKGLVLICSARGVPMSSGRVHAPLQHILTELPVPREYQLFPFIRNQLFQYNLCTLYLTAETEANSAPPLPLVVVAPGRAHCCWDSIQYPVPSFPYPPLKR